MNRRQHPMHHRNIQMSMITASEVLRLHEHAPTREGYLLTALACSTGARASEIAALRWSDIDLRGRVIRLGSKRARLVPMPIFLADALDRHRAAQDARRVGVKDGPAAYVFQSGSGGGLPAASLAMRFHVHAMRTLGRPLALHQLRRWALRHRMG